jgi:peptidyl-prolyl cis-trans isomerase SurA
MRALPLVLLIAASAIGAQTPVAPPATPLPPTAPTPAAASDTLPLERIVAVVGDRPILASDLAEKLNQRRAAGLEMPTDSAAARALELQVLTELIDEEILLNRAREEKIEVTDADLQPTVEAQLKRLRGQFKSDAEYAQALRGSGFGTPEEYRRWLNDEARRAQTQQKLISKLRQDGKIIPVPVSETDVTEAFEKNRGTLPKRPSTVTFRQIVIAPKASQAARMAAMAKAESLIVELRRGGDFEQIAKRESMDPGSKDVGGDLGWNRRGVMVPEFERMMFALAPGSISPVVETSRGFHIIRVDRVQPAEVKARHILIQPRIDSADVVSARVRADSVAALWRAGADFDSLVAKYHDPEEEKGSLQPFDRTQLPETYRTAFEGKGTGEFIAPFPIEDRSRGVPKFVVAQILQANEGGEYTVSDFRTTIRDQLAEERAIRRLIDSMKQETYVSIRM